MPLPSDPAQVRYYAAWVSNQASRRRGTCWCWSAPYASSAEASAEAKRRYEAGEATLAFLVRAQGERREVLVNSVLPRPLRRVLEHYLDLVAACEGPRPQKT